MSITITPARVGAHNGADISFHDLDPAGLQAQGVTVVAGYGALGSPPKWLTLDKIRALAGVGIAGIIGGEQGSTSWQGGAPVGAQHGAAARAYLTSIGYPTDCPFPFAFDSNVTAANLSIALDYAHAAHDALAGAAVFGAYGDLDILNALADISQFNWLCGARAWSAGEASHVPIHLVQGGGDAGLGVDWDLVLTPFRAWLGDVAAPPIPAPGVSVPVLVPPAPKATKPLPTLSINTTGKHDWRDPYVRVVQNVLVQKAGHRMPVDAMFGPITKAAVEDVQRFFHLHVDGVVGTKETWPAIQLLASR